MSYKITAPVPDHSGPVAGVMFSNGTAVVDESNRVALAYFMRRGYKVESDGPGEEPVSQTTDEPMKRPAGNASRADWVAFAVAKGLSAEDAEKATVKQLQELTEEDK